MESLIGVPTPQVDGRSRVTGAATFTADVALEGALWAKVVRSPIPHGRILSIDRSAALAVPGVTAILTAADLPDPNLRMGRSRLKDVPLLCDEVVRFIGDRVAIVAAETREAAEEAALLVEVRYEELPAVFDPLEAMKPDAPLVHPDVEGYVGFDDKVQNVRPNVVGSVSVSDGDVEAGFREADLIVEGTYRTQQVHQGYLEPNAFAVQIDDGGRLHIWGSNKVPFNLKTETAFGTGIEPAQIVCEAVSEGGDFGGKAGQTDPALLYAVAKVTGRPVKLVHTSSEDLAATAPRHPSQVWLKTGVKRDGTITAQEGWIVYNSGAYAGFKPSPRAMPGEGAELLKGCYEIPNVRLEGFSVYTNQVPGGYMRAPGQPQACFAVESHMNLIALRLGMDPYVLRARNVIKHETRRPDVLAPSILEQAKQAIDWDSPKPPNVGRGIAIAGRYTGGGEGSSDVTVNPDGTITVISAVPDNGPGGLTIAAQTAADFFGLPMERVSLIHGNTDSLPVDAASAGSRITNLVTRCVTAAGQQIIEQLTPIAASMLGAPTATWEKPGWRSPDGRFVSIGELAAEAIRPDDERAHAQVTLSFPNEGGLGYCAQAAEVEVDPETGQITILRMVSVQDTGTIMNPLSHRGHVQGQVIQGLGMALMEDMDIQEGRLGSAHLGEYKLPVMPDVPELAVIDVPSSGMGPLNVRSIGEIVIIPTAAAIAGAVMDAARIEVNSLPISAEQVLDAMEAKRPGR